VIGHNIQSYLSLNAYKKVQIVSNISTDILTILIETKNLEPDINFKLNTTNNMKRNFFITFLLSFYCFFIQAHNMSSKAVNNEVSSSKAFAEVCFNRLHNGWVEILIPVSQWNDTTVRFKSYLTNGSLYTSQGYTTQSLPKITSNGIQYYYLKAQGGGDINGQPIWNQTLTYEVSSPQDTAISKTLDALPQDQWNTAGTTGFCGVAKAEVCFNRLHNGWVEILIPVSQWKDTSIKFKSYFKDGTLSTSQGYSTQSLPKITSNGVQYYYFKGKGAGDINGQQVWDQPLTFEIGSSQDVAVSKILDALPQDQWNTAGTTGFCGVAKAKVCFNRLHNGWAEMLIPVSQWKGTDIIFKSYFKDGTLSTSQGYSIQSLPKVTSNGVQYYYFKGIGAGDINGQQVWDQPLTFEIGSSQDVPVSKILDALPQDQWNDFEKQKGCVTKAGGICIDRNKQDYTIYIPVSEWKGTNVGVRLFDANGVLMSFQNFPSPATINYNGRNSYKISGNPGTEAKIIIEVSSPTNAAVHMLLDTVQSLCYEGACTGNNNWSLSGNADTDPSANFIGTTDKQSLVFKTNNVENMRIDANGKIGMGTKNLSCADCTNYRLFVKDGIKTEKVKVEVASANGWADHVFYPNYQLLNLEEVERYILDKGHLPNIPSAAEVVKEGIDLAEMDARLLEKIEELTLYTIDLNKKNIELHQKNAELGGHVKNREKVIKILLKKVEGLERIGNKKSINSNILK